jgi:hypothetical protein
MVTKEKPMEDLSNKSMEELGHIVKQTEDKDLLRRIATMLDVSFSGNTGVDRLKSNIVEALNLEPENDTDENDPIVKAGKQLKADPGQNVEVKPQSVMEMSKTLQAQLDPFDPKWSEVERRAIVRARAMRLHRVKISNLDPNDAAVPGAIITVFNKYTGKVSKYIPFGDETEHGYHVPEIILNELKNRTFVMRKETRERGQASAFGVKKYRNVIMKKFNIEELDALTESEIQYLANDQKARGAIDLID